MSKEITASTPVSTKDVNIPVSIKDVLEWLPKSNSHMRETAIRYHSAKGVESYIIIGAALAKARDSEDWKKAQCNNMKEWCENEQRISYTQAIRMMTIWDKLSRLLPKYYEQMKEIPFTNLYEIARIADALSPAKLAELLEVAAVNTERHFKDNIRELEGKIPTDKCIHANMESWFKCSACHKFIKINDEPMEESKVRVLDSPLGKVVPLIDHNKYVDALKRKLHEIHQAVPEKG